MSSALPFEQDSQALVKVPASSSHSNNLRRDTAAVGTYTQASKQVGRLAKNWCQLHSFPGLWCTKPQMPVSSFELAAGKEVASYRYGLMHQALSIMQSKHSVTANKGAQKSFPNFWKNWPMKGVQTHIHLLT